MVPPTDNAHTDIIDLSINNIRKTYGKTPVLDNVSLDVYNGELCCLLGPSGCGKTTSLRIIDGLLQPDEGTIRLSGRDITGMPAQKRNIGLVFQNYALFPNMSVFDNVAYGLRRRRVSVNDIKARVQRSLETVELAGFENRRIHEISGGQQQRVALARALVIEPALLLLDEPLSNLDARLRMEMRQEIKRIQKDLGITTVYVTHDQEEAMSLADRIVVMNNGRIEQIGSPREIYENPATLFVADFIGHCNFIEAEIDHGNIHIFGQNIPVNGEQLPEKTKVVCAIRPERIRLGTVDESTLKGRIKDVVYFGSTLRYRIVIENAATSYELTAEVPASQAIFRADDIAGVEVRHDDMRFFNK